MKFTTIFAAVAVAAVSVGAVPAAETNGDRLARGLPPLPPVRRATPIGAKRSTPSGTPGQCNTGPVQCCNSVTLASNPLAQLVIGLLGIVVGPNVAVGLTCAPLLIIGGNPSCLQQPVCCTNNSFNGLISLGCSPVTI